MYTIMCCGSIHEVRGRSWWGCTEIDGKWEFNQDIPWDTYITSVVIYPGYTRRHLCNQDRPWDTRGFLLRVNFVIDRGEMAAENGGSKKDYEEDVKKCNKVVKATDNGIECEVCHKWYHIRQATHLKSIINHDSWNSLNESTPIIPLWRCRKTLNKQQHN